MAGRGNRQAATEPPTVLYANPADLPYGRKAKTDPGTDSISAAAANVTDRRRTTRKGGQVAAWQNDAWHFYDSCGEFRFGANWLGNAMSRCRLVLRYDEQVANDSGETELITHDITEGPEFDILTELGDETTQSQMLRTWGIHLTVPGDSYLVGEPAVDEQPGFADRIDPEVMPDRWEVYSADELTQQGDHWYDRRGDQPRVIGAVAGSDANTDGQPAAAVIRLWRSHPRRKIEADSPARAQLPILRELEQLTKHVAANIDSRLAGAGILLLPQEMTFPAALNADGVPIPGTIQTFMAQLGEAIMTPVGDRSSAAALVPFLLQMPTSAIEHIKHMVFATPLDAAALELRVECIRRLALGMDLPPEILLGQADSNHWSAWQIDESALKIHIEPMLEILCAGLMSQLILPVLEQQGVTPKLNLRLEGDTSDLRVRPNRGPESQQLHDRVAINDAALRRESGFEESDAPDDTERQDIILTKLALGASSPELQEAALRELGINLTIEQASQPAPVVALPAVREQPTEDPRALPEPESASPAELDPSLAASGFTRAEALLMTSELIVTRAHERAVNKLARSRNRSRLGPYPEDAVRAALCSAWDHVPGCAMRLAVPPSDLQQVLEAYTSQLLITGEEHRPHVLAQWLSRFVLGREPLRQVL
jgi:hypothetical protein